MVYGISMGILGQLNNVYRPKQRRNYTYVIILCLRLRLFSAFPDYRYGLVGFFLIRRISLTGKTSLNLRFTRNRNGGAQVFNQVSSQSRRRACSPRCDPLVTFDQPNQKLPTNAPKEAQMIRV